MITGVHKAKRPGILKHSKAIYIAINISLNNHINGIYFIADGEYNMKQVNIAEIKDHFPDYLKDVEAGNDVGICRRNVLVAVLWEGDE